MVKMKKPDWKCVFTYVQSFYRRFRNGRDPPTPTRVQLDPESVRAELNPGVIRIQKHEYLFESSPVVEPFQKFKNFEIKPLPKTTFQASLAEFNVAILNLP